MSWYVHPSKQLRDDELPPELVVTNRDGSIEQVYVPYDATGEHLKAENAKLRELVRIAGTYCVNGRCGKDDGCPLYLGKPYCALPDRMHELGIEEDA